MDATVEETFVGEIRRKSVRRTYKIEEVGGINFRLLTTRFIYIISYCSACEYVRFTGAELCCIH